MVGARRSGHAVLVLADTLPACDLLQRTAFAEIIQSALSGRPKVSAFGFAPPHSQPAAALHHTVTYYWDPEAHFKVH